MIKKYLFYYIFGILLVATGALCARFVSQQRAALAHYPFWQSSKFNLALPVNATAAYVNSRKALATEQLDLSAWNGFEEILTSQTFRTDEVEFDFTLQDTLSTFYFFLEKSERIGKGFQFSFNPHRGNRFFEVDSVGKFLQSEPLPNLQMNVNNHLRCQKQAGFFHCELNGFEIPARIPAAPQGGLVGFKGSNIPIYVDNFELKADGLHFRENFSPPDFLATWILSVLGLALLILGTLTLAQGKKTLYIWTLIFLFLIPTLLIGIKVDNQSRDVYRDHSTFFEKLFSSTRFPKEKIEGEIEVEKRIREQLPSWQKADFRLAVLGSSQTWGAGALTMDQSLVPTLCQDIQKRLPKKKVACLNFAISGHVLYEQYGYFFRLEEEFKLRPSLVLINMGVNDRGSRSAGDQLYRIVRLLKKRQIPVVFSQEPTCDSHDHRYAESDQLIKTVLEENRIPWIPLDEIVRKNENRGIFWWDFVHMTSFGQTFAASVLSDWLFAEKLIQTSR